MKKFFVIAMIACMGVGASAQVMTSRTYVKEKKQTTWYARLGLSINNVAGGGGYADYNSYGSADLKGDYEKTTIGSRAGMDIDFGFQRPIGKAGIYWGMELGIGTRGGSLKEKEGDLYYEYNEEGNKEYYYEEGEAKSNILTWNIKYSPFTFGYKYSITDNLKLDGHLGAFVSYDFAGKGVTKFSEDHDAKSSLSELRDDYDFMAFDAGLQVGVGVWWKKFNFDITYQRGFVTAAKVYADTDYNLYSSNLMLRLGFAF